MRCTICQYPLWDIRERRCPECGTAFLPSEFEFVPNSVQFRCPRCNQSYYGTDPRGHLEPPEFDCIKCAQRVRMDEMVLLPTEGVAEEITRPDVNPWLDGTGSWATRWLKTVGMALFGPVRLMKGTPDGAPTAPAGRFCALTNGVYLLFGASLLVAAMVFPFFAGGGGVSAAMSVLAGVGAALVAIPLLAAVWGLAAHGVLRLTGPTHKGPARTVQALFYASGCNALMAVPCLGFYLVPFAMLWWWGSAAAMIVEGQKVRVWRAIVATAVVPLLCLAALVASVGVAMWQARQAMATVQAAGVLPQSVPPLAAHRLLVLYAEANAGAGPDHAARVLLAYTPDSSKPLPWAGGGPMTLRTLRLQPPAERDRQLDQMATLVGAGMPNPAAAHRVDDLVFMYTGVDLLQPQDAGLWVVVQCPDPDLGPPPFATTPIVVVRADGTSRNVRPSDLPAEVDRQNELRRSLGVPEIPDPTRVQQVRPGPPGSTTAPSG